MSSPQLPDWNISDLYSQSFQIVKKNKTLWLFGLILSGLTSFNLSQNFDPSEMNLNPTQWISSQNVATSSANLSTPATQTPFNDSIYQLFINQNYGLYTLIGLEIIGIVIIAITVSLIFSAWIQACMLNATEQAIDEHHPTIASSSKPSMASIGSIIWLDTIPWIIFCLIIAAGYLIGIPGVFYTDWPIKIFFIVLLTATIGFTLHGLFVLTLVSIWAKRLVVIYHYNAFNSFKKSYQLVRLYFWKMLLLGLINNLASGLIMLCLVGVPIAILGTIIFMLSQISNPNASLIWTISGIILAPMIIVAIIAIILLTGIITAFKTSVWSLAFKKIYQGDKNV